MDELIELLEQASSGDLEALDTAVELAERLILMQEQASRCPAGEDV